MLKIQDIFRVIREPHSITVLLFVFDVTSEKSSDSLSNELQHLKWWNVLLGHVKMC